jgi:mannose-6-phosphate isomerase-like protein (cupin superfamily)
MSTFNLHQVKGISRLLIDSSIDPDRLHFHISEIEPGTRAHPPHTHDGVEAFYILEGEGTVEVQGECQTLKANEAIVIDPGVPHGLVNTGSTRMRYIVMIAKA